MKKVITRKQGELTAIKTYSCPCLCTGNGIVMAVFGYALHYVNALV